MVDGVEVLVIEIEWPPVVDTTLPGVLFFHHLIDNKFLKKKCKYMIVRVIGELENFSFTLAFSTVALQDFSGYKKKACKFKNHRACLSFPAVTRTQQLL